ncbi:hypothetical protein TSMEX_011480 [Taenia solium]|eukprot:TsM_000698500 transcript=TsM_000698500 gene=TsM_000698500
MDFFAPLFKLIGAPPGMSRSNGFLQDILGSGLGNVLFGRYIHFSDAMSILPKSHPILNGNNEVP